ncbi:unnamed protein product [Rodentolepis nana]|uniref:PDZ domain-containing protein n=1 Tax=Rodentolepis nana TaxID=102285 RepID=A0A158QGF4_RODNA|nr:unnamed protein product [Rodentolepis nana]
MCDSDSELSISMNENANDNEDGSIGLAVIKISVPSVNIEKVYNFIPSDVISDVKDSIIKDLNLEFRDILNYGLFLPPTDGKAGKFLQEDRQLKEYPFTSSVGYFELKYKQRIYRNLPVNVSKLRKINSKATLRQFLSHVRFGELDKINKLLDKGVDPNFQNRDDGETPLTVAVRLPKPKSIIMALVAGGAHLDFRSADSCTPLHKAAINGNYEAIMVLLDLGQSPNVRDSNGLTPLYHCILNDTSAMCVERLLYDHSILGVVDGAGMQEIHQACRFGRGQHLEQLIAYGADINSQTTFDGNTPLHFCAYNGQESCARLLLFRGANRTLKNRAGHTAQQEAILANHSTTAALIWDFQDKDVVPLRGSPKYNQRRRQNSVSRTLGQRCASLGRLSGSYMSMETSKSNTLNPRRPPLANAIADFAINGHEKPPLASGTSLYGDGGCKFEFFSYAERPCSHSTNGRFSEEGRKMLRGIRQNSLPASQSLLPNGNLTIGSYQQNRSALNTQNGLSPYRDNSDTMSIRSYASSVGGRYSETRTLSTSSSRFNTLREGRGGILSVDTKFLPRVIVLQKGQRGFGFVVQSKKATRGIFVPTEEIPSLHYLGHVEENNVAHRANLLPHDYILEVNGDDVATLSHQEVVEMIRDSGDMLSLKVVTLPPEDDQQFDFQEDNMEVFQNDIPGDNFQYSTLGRRTNENNDFISQSIVPMSLRSVNNGSSSNRQLDIANEIASHDINNGFSTIRRSNALGQKSFCKEVPDSADYHQGQSFATMPPKPFPNGNGYSSNVTENYSNAGTLRKSKAQTTNGFPPLPTKAPPVPSPAPPPPPPPPPPSSNGSSTIRSNNGHPTATAMSADKNGFTRRPAFPTSQKKSAESQESTPSPPTLFRASNGAVNPLLASVLAKLEASEDPDDLVFNPEPPKPEFTRPAPAFSFEDNLKAAIARRRKQMDQSRESSESEDDLIGTRSMNEGLNTHQMSTPPSQLSNQPPKPPNANTLDGPRRALPSNRFEFLGGTHSKMGHSGVPQPPPPPHPPSHSSNWTT